ncbi:hypothetical protein QR680_006359 [Steinernema hermaphroditum]|uniref:G-protein coupled receptors family 1 profile domain-containing protein n=1 Tax=Steinernema hermaphroditum TaxID=289476 RepID=A0AA39LX02_9BILA|nr:hypothetical protein QR680_006359 [Steinernema hermaphroditum]
MSATGYILIGMAIFGLFGNVNIVVATFRKKNLRNKCGMLICLIAVYDTVCLLCEVVGGVRIISGVRIDRQTCFKVNIAYFWAQMLSVSTLIGLALDRLIAVTFPLKYVSYSTVSTVIVSTLPGVIFSVVFTALGLIYWDEENTTVPVCIPTVLFPHWIQVYPNWTLMFMNMLVFCVYSSAYVALLVRKRQFLQKSHLHSSLKNHERAMKSITVFMVIFTISWFVSQIEMTLTVQLNHPPNLFPPFMRGSLFVPVIVSYSQCYYVLFWRSSEYREAFIKQLSCGRSGDGCCKTLYLQTSVSSTT